MFTWFYCVDIIDALLLMAASSVVFLIIKEFCSKQKWWPMAVVGMAAVWLLVIGYATLGNREPAGQLGVRLIPLYSYYLAFGGGEREMLRSCFMNIILFYPAGLLASAVYLRQWRTGKRVLLLAVIGCCVSISIEVIQFVWQLGLAEVDDVIHNTLGTAIGAWVGSLHLQFALKTKKENQ